MMKIFASNYKGSGAFAEIARFMTTVGRMLNNIRVYGGHANVSPSGISIYVDLGYSGTAYNPYGVQTTGLTDGTKGYLRLDELTGAITEVETMPEPWGANERYRAKSSCVGDCFF